MAAVPQLFTRFLNTIRILTNRSGKYISHQFFGVVSLSIESSSCYLSRMRYHYLYSGRQDPPFGSFVETSDSSELPKVGPVILGERQRSTQYLCCAQWEIMENLFGGVRMMGDRPIHPLHTYVRIYMQEHSKFHYYRDRRERPRRF